LTHQDPKRANEYLAKAKEISVEEPEPRQHYLLTKAWLLHQIGSIEGAFEAMEAAAGVFDAKNQAGDHTPHLVARLSRFNWPENQAQRIAGWLALLNDRVRREEQ
jgi:hypothetical protein